MFPLSPVNKIAIANICINVLNFADYNAHSIGIVLLWFAAFLTLYTGYDYVKKGIDHAID